MIRYRLRCHKKHEFDAWFASSAAYDKQAKRKLVECVRCGSTDVAKAVMAPRINRRRSKSSTPAPTPASEARVPVVQLPETAESRHVEMQRELAAMIRNLRREVEAKADYVGPRFADEARKIHHEEVPARGIYGEATPEEVKGLSEEGIEFYPLPQLPEDKN